ncbi:hypothetical protein AMECASPLE_006656, partial [Ameca splendens]
PSHGWRTKTELHTKETGRIYESQNAQYQPILMHSSLGVGVPNSSLPCDIKELQNYALSSISYSLTTALHTLHWGDTHVNVLITLIYEKTASWNNPWIQSKVWFALCVSCQK